MHPPPRRAWLRQAALLALAPALPLPVAARATLPTGPLHFPADLGAHPAQRIEWWYLTGHAASGGRRFGFQVTFFRSRIAANQALASRFAAKHLVFAHAALTDLQGKRLLHDQRIARWSGAPPGPGNPLDSYTAVGETDIQLGDWSLRRGDDGHYAAQVNAEGFALALECAPTQPLLLQGPDGLSRKGPDPDQASRYYSQPQLAVSGKLGVADRSFAIDPAAPATNAAWLDHEWSDELLHPEAVGWDWSGMNLHDGGALTLFRLRRRDGSSLWAGGSFRPARGDGAVRNFGPDELHFTPGRTWTSPRTGSRYPVEWTVDTPLGRYQIRALLDDQELDSRGSTGAVYWEGVSELRDAGGSVVAGGYLEMTGYGEPLRL